MIHERGAREEPVREHGGDGQRHQERGQNGDDVGDAQGSEELSFHPLQGEQRHEYEDDEDRAEDDRVANLAARLIHHPQRRLRRRETAVFAEAAKDVLDVDDRVVDELADRHGQAAERHRVDRHSQPFEDQPRDHDREGNGGERDEGGAEVEEEEKEHDDHEHAAVAEGLDDVADAQVDERLLLVNLWIDSDVGRERRAQFIEGPGDVFRQSPCVGPRLLGDDEHDRGKAVDGSVATLDLGRLGDAGDLAEHHRPVAGRLDDHRREVVERLDPAERTNEQFVSPLIQIATGGVGIARLHRRLHLREADVVAEEERRIDEYLELLSSSPHRHDLRDAGDRQQPLPHDPIGQRADLDRGRGPGFACHPHVHDLPHDRRDWGELRPNPLRHPIEGQGDLLRHDLPVDVDVGAPAELDGDHRQADAGRAAHGLHPRRPVEDRLEGKRDQRLHLLGGKPRRFGEDRDPRPIEIGEDVDRQPRERDAAVGHDGDRENDREQAVAEGVLDDSVEHGSPGLGRFGSVVGVACGSRRTGRCFSGCGRRGGRSLRPICS